MTKFKHRILYLLPLLVLTCGLIAWLPARPKPKADHAAMPMSMPMQSNQRLGTANVPAYHPHPPQGPLPATQPPSKYSDPRVRTIYALAARIKKVLYQEPCYCRCDRDLGHTSLLSCFVGNHASVCEVCLMEAAYTYQETRKGLTAAQIRKNIEHGDWRSINLNDYMQAPAR